MFIAIKTDDGRIKGKISFYCKVLHVSRQAFNKFLKAKDTPWKYQALADAMLDICSEDECNDTYGMILSILVYTFFSRMFDLMLPPVAKHSIVVA